MTLRERKIIGTSKKYNITVCGEFSLEVTMDLLPYRLRIDEWQLGFILIHLAISSLASNADISSSDNPDVT